MDLSQILSDHRMWLNDKTSGKRAYLSGANLTRANLSEVNLSEANFRRADLSEANLSEAILSGAYLSGADLLGANLSGADLTKANLSGADLSGADLRGADLRGADLSGASGIVSFGPVGNENRIGYAVRHPDGPRVYLGCFTGTLEDAVMAIRKKYGEDSSYEKIVVAVCSSLS